MAASRVPAQKGRKRCKRVLDGRGTKSGQIFCCLGLHKFGCDAWSKSTNFQSVRCSAGKTDFEPAVPNNRLARADRDDRQRLTPPFTPDAQILAGADMKLGAAERLELGLGIREVFTSTRAVVVGENCLEQRFNLAQAWRYGVAAKKFDQVGHRAQSGLFAGRD